MKPYACILRHRISPDWHYYIQDYMGNVRMVVNSDGTVEQQNHYYPYGGIIGNLSTNQDLQTFKFEGKELDRKFGLDWYDIHARQYDAIGVPSWNKVDALAEKYYHLSPYVFAGGNPVNLGDYDGKDQFYVNDGGYIFRVKKSDETILYGRNQQTKEIESIDISDKNIVEGLVVKPHEMSSINTVSNMNDVKEGKANIKSGGYYNEHSCITTSDQISEIFMFMGDHTNIEWHLSGYSDGSYLLGTNQSKTASDLGANRGGKRVFKAHCHPNNPEPSETDIENVANDSTTKAYIYFGPTSTAISYGSSGVKEKIHVSNKKTFRFNF